MSEIPAAVSAPAPAPSQELEAAPRLTRPASSAWIWALAVAALAVAGAVVALRLASLQRAMTSVEQRAGEMAALRASDLAERQVLEERIDAATRRTAQLEQELTLAAGRDTAADSELRRLREQQVLAEVDELLTLAASQLQVTHDPAAAITALSSADARLARMPRAQFYALREALARDIDRLRRTQVLDVAGTAIRMDRLAQGPEGVDSWHLLADPTRRLAAPPKPPAANAAPTHLGWLGRELNDTLRDLVRIRDVEAPDSVLLPADQQPLLREHLRVRLLMARQAMLMRNQTLFRADLADSLAIINRYFDTSDPKVASAVAQIKSLSAVAVDIPMPTLDDSLAALRAAHLP